MLINYYNKEETAGALLPDMRRAQKKQWKFSTKGYTQYSCKTCMSAMKNGHETDIDTLPEPLPASRETVCFKKLNKDDKAVLKTSIIETVTNIGRRIDRYSMPKAFLNHRNIRWRMRHTVERRYGTERVSSFQHDSNHKQVVQNRDAEDRGINKITTDGTGITCSVRRFYRLVCYFYYNKCFRLSSPLQCAATHQILFAELPPWYGYRFPVLCLSFGCCHRHQ